MNYTLTLTLNLNITQEQIDEIIDTAGYGIGYWAKVAIIDDDYYQVVCEDGAIKMPSPIYPSIRKNAAVSTTIDTDCFVRFKDAYDTEVQDWVDAAAEGVIKGPNAWDGYLAAVTADALVKAQETGAIERIETAVEKPEFYK